MCLVCYSFENVSSFTVGLSVCLFMRSVLIKWRDREREKERDRESERGREREKERGRKRERGREREGVN
jgi:hypothetical protein